MKCTPLYFFYWLMASLLITSCGILRKTTEKQVLTENKAEQKHSDSTSSKSLDSVTKKESIRDNEQSVFIEFDTATNDAPDTLKINSVNGNDYFLPIRQKIKSIKVSNSQIVKHSDSTAKKEASQNSVKKDDSVTDNKTVVEQHSTKTSFGIPWYAYLIGIVAALACLVFFVYRKKKRLLGNLTNYI